MAFNLDLEYPKFKEDSIKGRYLTPNQILGFLKTLPDFAVLKDLGASVQKRSIPCIEFGKGKNRVLMWSQMHGNESTTTKAVLDLINFLSRTTTETKEILEKCTLRIIPMLNPDGAEMYTRLNANDVDLNRDAQDLSQPESNVLRKAYEDFKPSFCFNLHDQRTIFGVGDNGKPATVSFLSPACDAQRSISDSRKRSMQLIIGMHKALKKHIPGQIGRYDDTFNANCVGDTFQMLGTPTILFEAGHFPEDYEREVTRKYIFLALYSALRNLAQDAYLQRDYTDYFQIPENKRVFQDILIHHVGRINKDYHPKESLGLVYEEKLAEGKIQFIPKIDKKGKLESVFGHINYNCLDDNDLKKLEQQSFWKLLQNS